MGHLKKVNGRYIFTRGELFAGEKRTADAEGQADGADGRTDSGAEAS